MIPKRTLLILAALALYATGKAQADVTASGAEGVGSGGTVSYSVGQVAYTQYTGTGGRVSEGVEQAYLITELGTENPPEISFTCEVFPNPTVAGVKLVLYGMPSFQNLDIAVLETTGKLLLSQRVSGAENEIPLEQLPAGTYLLRLSAGEKTIRSFKIIKY